MVTAATDATKPTSDPWTPSSSVASSHVPLRPPANASGYAAPTSCHPRAPTKDGAWAAREVKKLNAVHKICWLRMWHPRGLDINLQARATSAYEWCAQGDACLCHEKNKCYMWGEWTPNWLDLPCVCGCLCVCLELYYKYWNN